MVPFATWSRTFYDHRLRQCCNLIHASEGMRLLVGKSKRSHILPHGETKVLVS
jgi:hypothetical protein